MTLNELFAPYKKKISELSGVPEDTITITINSNPVSEYDWMLDDSKGISSVWHVSFLYPKKYIINEVERRVSEAIIRFTLYAFPGCCAFLISTNAYVNGDFTNRGIGTLANQLRIDIATALGYSAIVCTDVDTNTHQRKILAKNRWKDIFTIRNKRTNNIVHISVKQLKENT
jgi:hypothetical protein